ncbi:hypothetical protein, partial [Bordetella holmesii]|uniref:hypothetical protein n=1 Tax=Bordetella holmesii TaxID=35814 RepID=UPI001F1DD546
ILAPAPAPTNDVRKPESEFKAYLGTYVGPFLIFQYPDFSRNFPLTSGLKLSSDRTKALL